MSRQSENNIRRFPRGYSKEESRERIDWIEGHTGVRLDAERNTTEEMKGIIENHIGFLNLPMGVAGPLRLAGDYASGDFLVPVCTVEGSLVASMTRGMQVTSKSGGIKTTHVKQQMTRSPFFILEQPSEQGRLINWIREHFTEIRAEAESTTRYGRLVQLETHVINRFVVIDFIFTTGNAAGQNMVTIATQKACEYIKQHTGVSYVLDSNFSSDKKSSDITRIRGRGHYVIAETFIPHQILHRMLGVSAKEIDIMQEFGPYASHISGSNGIQLHIANALTAIYLATGQDTACVAENALGYTQTKTTDEGVKFWLTMPSVTVGTVGGGTRLVQQRKNLEVLGCTAGEHASKKLAEIICGSALCLEISLLAAILSNTWVQAHIKYGRTSKKEKTE